MVWSSTETSLQIRSSIILVPQFPKYIISVLLSDRAEVCEEVQIKKLLLHAEIDMQLTK
jgi:hypothetical protein